MLSIYFIREIEDKIRTLSQEFPAIVLTGARQVGKTTILKSMFPGYAYVSLDMPSLAVLAQENSDLFLARFPPPVIIDEVQYAPQLFRYLEIWIDQNRSTKGQIILTGSQKFNLMKEISESLAGRIAVLELEPLSFHELSQHNKVNSQLILESFERGFYPELWREPNRNSNHYYQSYLATYIERDVRQIINITNLLDIEKFIRLLASRTGQIVEKESLAKDVGIRVPTLNNWLSALEASNQITFLQPYYENFGTRLIKSPKVYFSDVGFCSYLLGLDKDSLLKSPILGSLWEDLVFNELCKRNQCQEKPGQFWYYRDSLPREGDILYVNKGEVHYIECKWSQSPEKKSATQLATIANSLKSRAVRSGSCSIISRADISYPVTNSVFTYPLQEFQLPK